MDGDARAALWELESAAGMLASYLAQVRVAARGDRELAEAKAVLAYRNLVRFDGARPLAEPHVAALRDAHMARIGVPKVGGQGWR